MIKHLLYSALVVVLFSHCTKYEEEIVPANVAPPDGTVENVVIDSYINKVYISLLGREPDQSEFQSAFTLLKSNNAATNDRETFLDDVLQRPEYNARIYTLSRQDYLDNVDTAQVPFFISIYSSLLGDSTYFPFWDLLEYEIERLVELREIPSKLDDGTLSFVEMHRRCCNNTFYDEINMGSLNFVVAVFQNFLNRYPSENELDEGIKMVDGLNGILFLQVGASKDDFLDVFFNSTDYFEGQVRSLYLRYLFREPNSAEMSIKSIEYKQSKDYKDLQKSILVTDEYLGIN